MLVKWNTNVLHACHGIVKPNRRRISFMAFIMTYEFFHEKLSGKYAVNGLKTTKYTTPILSARVLWSIWNNKVSIGIFIVTKIFFYLSSPKTLYPSSVCDTSPCDLRRGHRKQNVPRYLASNTGPCYKYTYIAVFSSFFSPFCGCPRTRKRVLAKKGSHEIKADFITNLQDCFQQIRGHLLLRIQ